MLGIAPSSMMYSCSFRFTDRLLVVLCSTEWMTTPCGFIGAIFAIPRLAFLARWDFFHIDSTVGVLGTNGGNVFSILES